jgi:H+-transporting ATPase
MTPPPPARDAAPPAGLTGAEARRRLVELGPNTIPDAAMRPWRRALTKFWAPVPWMLEAAIVLELALGRYVEASIIALLLAFNAALGWFQEGRAQATLAALKSRLALSASVRRDNAWATVPAADLVAGDTIKLSVGAVVPMRALRRARYCSTSPCSPANPYRSRPGRACRRTRGRW